MLFLTFNGLSKNYRSCGYRAGWMVVSGEKRRIAADYIEGLGMLASMRLCSNTPGQLAIQTALGGYQSIDDLVAARRPPASSSATSRTSMLTAIPGVTCVKPKAALYMFPKLDPRCTRSSTTSSSPTSCWPRQKVLIVQGTGFNWPRPTTSASCSCRTSDDLGDAIGRIATLPRCTTERVTRGERQLS